MTDPSKSPTIPFPASLGNLDQAGVTESSLWTILSCSPGIGVSLTDVEGRLLFINNTAQVLFSESTDIDYSGKTIADFHPREFVQERLAMLRQAVEKKKPIRVEHVYHGRRIESTLWPILDRKPPYHRVIVVSRLAQGTEKLDVLNPEVETAETRYIDLGKFDVLSRRELEVFVMLGHGLSVPRTAAVLHRSPKTIQRHKATLSKKLGLRGQAELVQFVTQMGLELSDTRLQRFSKNGKSTS